MKCACGAIFLSTIGHTKCWECRNLAGAPTRLPLPPRPPASWLHSWASGIGATS